LIDDLLKPIEQNWPATECGVNWQNGIDDQIIERKDADCVPGTLGPLLCHPSESRVGGARPEGWAAGMIYAVANLDRQACGVPGLLNSEFIEFFSVSMETVRKRAANVMNQISSLWFPTQSILATIHVCNLLR
jgi:hypothetical protein